MTLAARITLWLAVGHLVIGALFWALLHVPESTIWTLALSAALALVLVFITAIVESIAIRSWQIGDGRPEGQPLREEQLHPRSGRALALPSFVRSLPYGRALAGFLVASLIFLLFYRLTGRASTWWSIHHGEVEAWLMMRTRSPRTAWLLASGGWLIWIVRYPFALSLSVGLVGAWVRGTMPAHPLRWIRSAVHWRPILGIGLALLIFVVLPWQLVYWRPRSLPANWLEPLFVGTKLFFIYVLMNIGWAIVLSAGARRA